MNKKDCRIKNDEKRTKFYNVNDVVDILGVSRPKAYSIMQQLNLELKNRGFITVAGKVSAQYFNEKLYIAAAS